VFVDGAVVEGKGSYKAVPNKKETDGGNDTSDKEKKGK